MNYTGEKGKQRSFVLRQRLPAIRLKETSSTPTIVGELRSTSILSENNDHWEQVDQQLGVLIEHRDTLLQTGTYTHQDALIQELERRIQEAMKRKSTSSHSRYQ